MSNLEIVGSIVGIIIWLIGLIFSFRYLWKEELLFEDLKLGTLLLITVASIIWPLFAILVLLLFAMILIFERTFFKRIWELFERFFDITIIRKKP